MGFSKFGIHWSSKFGHFLIGEVCQNVKKILFRVNRMSSFSEFSRRALPKCVPKDSIFLPKQVKILKMEKKIFNSRLSRILLYPY